MRYLFRLLLTIYGLTIVEGTLWAQAGRFATVDAYAMAAKPGDEVSLERLGAYLKAASTRETDRARAAFVWVTSRVAYDANLYFRTAGQTPIVEAEQMRRDPRFAGQMPEVVLRDRKAVCLGYSRLLEALCREMGLTAYTANGMALGNGVASTQGPNHAWNIVKSEGAWHLMDATWAAGHLGPDRQFVRKYTDSLFFPAPGVFVRDHLPADPAYQLLASPVSKQAFQQKQGGTSGGQYAFADSLNAMTSLDDAEIAYRSSARALAYDPDALYARLKLTEFHTNLASAGLQHYQKGIEAYNSGQIASPTPEMLALLTQIEGHLQQSRRLMGEVPKAQLGQIPSARENLKSIDESLRYILKQRQFWANLREGRGN